MSWNLEIQLVMMYHRELDRMPAGFPPFQEIAVGHLVLGYWSQ